MTTSVKNPSTRSNSITTGSQSQQELRDSLKNPDQQSKRAEVINWLNDLGLPALPIAPAQSGKQAFTGKNPSYIPASGKAQLINHRQYQDELPSIAQQEKWFANSLNGIGTLGGWNNLVFIDFDVKNFQGDKEACKSAAFEIAANYQQLSGKEAFLQRSHSGGWHVGVRVRQILKFTNFALSPGGKHLGEAIGRGRFIVLAPTIGTSGNRYQIHQWGDPSGEVESLESIGIYSSSSKTVNNNKPLASPAVLNSVPGCIPLADLLSKKNQAILNGTHLSGDRSAALTSLLNEAYGWVNWTNKNAIAISGSPEELGQKVGATLELDSDRIDRIIKSIRFDKCSPAAHFQGSDKSCWMKIYRLDRASFDEKCPDGIKESIRLEWQQRQIGTVREATTGRVVTPPSTQKVISGNFGGNGNGNSGNGNGGSGNGNGSNGGNGDKPDWDNIYKLVEDLVNQGLTPAQFQAALLDLSAQTSYPLNGLKDIAKELEAEASQSTGLEDDKKDLDKLLEYQNQELDLFKVFPESIAKPLLTKSNSDRNDPMFMYMNFLSVVGAKLGTHIAIMGKEGSTLADSWIEFAILWMIIVAPPSSGKSQSQSTILKPITEKQNKARRKFREDLRKLDKLKTDWNSKTHEQREKLKDTLENPQKFEEQIKPPRIQVIESGTPEAISKRVSENPAKEGTLLAFDEMLQIMHLDQYKKGGDSRQMLLKYWSRPLTGEVLRMDDRNSIQFNYQTLGISTGIQPVKVPVVMSDPDDGDGFHRIQGRLEANLRGNKVEAIVHSGDRRDAILHSVGANSKHGLRRTNEDKRHAVELLLRDKEWSKWSNCEIARKACVTEFLVRSVRKAIFDLNEAQPTERLVERNGKTFSQNSRPLAKVVAGVI